MRRRAPLTLVTAALAAALAFAGIVAVPDAPAQAAHRDTSAGPPSIEVYSGGGGVLSDGGDLVVSVVIANPSTELVPSGQVSLSVTSSPLASPSALASFQQDPTKVALRPLATAATSPVAAGGTELVALIDVPAATLALPSTSPGVFGLSATIQTADGPLGTGAGTVVVPGSTPATVGVAAVMPITAPASGNGLISAQDLTTYTGPEGLFTRDLAIAQHNPNLTIGIDPMILASIRVLGQSAPASAQAWLSSLGNLSNPSFALQYGDADPALQIQAGLSAPLQPSDFGYAMSAGNFNTPLTAAEPTATPTPTPSPTAPAGGAQLPPLSELIGFPYSLGGIAWPTPGTVSGADLAGYKGSGLTTTIVSASNTNASDVSEAPDALLHTQNGTALVTDDALSDALQAAATASDPNSSAVATATLNAQLALAAQNASSGTIVLASLGRIWPTDAARASTAVASTFYSPFSHPASIASALASTPTSGLALVDKHDSSSRVDQVGSLLDLAGESRSGGSPPTANIANFSSALTTPALLTGDVRARLLDLFSVGWASSSDWHAAVAKQLTSMKQTLEAVQIVSPGSIRQASRQALIPITVTNKLAHPIDVILRATPSSARLEVDSDTEKTIAGGSSAKILVPVKAQLSNGTVFLGLQLYSKTGVAIGSTRRAEVDVHADWEGIGAMIFGVLVVALFGFGLMRTIQRRRRERDETEGEREGDRTEGDRTEGEGGSDDPTTPSATDAPPASDPEEAPRG